MIKLINFWKEFRSEIEMIDVLRGVVTFAVIIFETNGVLGFEPDYITSLVRPEHYPTFHGGGFLSNASSKTTQNALAFRPAHFERFSKNKVFTGSITVLLCRCWFIEIYPQCTTLPLEDRVCFPSSSLTSLIFSQATIEVVFRHEPATGSGQSGQATTSDYVHHWILAPCARS